MHCDNCSHKLESTDKFCTKCGARVQSEAKTHSVAPVSEEKWWYRLMKVIYIILYVGSIAIVCGVAFSEMPRRSLDGDLSLIRCNNGKNYAPAKNSIDIYGDTLSTYDDQRARILCAYDTTSYYSRTAPSYKNYAFAPAYNKVDYGSWFLYSLLSLIITWAVLKLIRLSVRYIAFGSKPRWKSEFRSPF